MSIVRMAKEQMVWFVAQMTVTYIFKLLDNFIFRFLSYTTVTFKFSFVLKVIYLIVYVIQRLIFRKYVAECTQLEDPRLEWRAIQEAMLRDYLTTAQDVLEVS